MQPDSVRDSDPLPLRASLTSAPGTALLVLRGALAERPSVVRAFLNAALASPVPHVDTLVAAGVQRWDAQDLLRRLESAGELRAGQWVPEALLGYRALLTPPDERPRTVDSARAEDLRHADDHRDLPREKALSDGVENLDDAELIALLLRTGVTGTSVVPYAQELLHKHDGLVGLSRRSALQLCEDHGLGPAKAAELAAAFELGRRLAAASLRERPLLKQADAVARFLAPLMASLPHEEFWMLALDARGALIGQPRVVARGEVDGTEVPVRSFYRLALAAGASCAVAVHNHPTGDPSPSAADRVITARLVQAGRSIDLPLFDHVILGTAGTFISMRGTHPDCWR